MSKKIILLAAPFALLAFMPWGALAQVPTPATGLPQAAYGDGPVAMPEAPLGPSGDYAEAMQGNGDSYDWGGRPSPPNGFWGSTELLLWWGQGSHVPSLITTSPPGTPRNSVGVPIAAALSQPPAVTQTLFGNSLLGQQMQTGGRITFGKWIDQEQTGGIGMRFYALSGDTATQQESSNNANGNRIIGIPFYNVIIGREDALLVGYPGFTEGTVTATHKVDFLGAEAFGRLMLEENAERRVDMISGYQFLRLDDRIQMDSDIIGRGQLNNGIMYKIHDRFKATNEFHGGELGFLSSRNKGRWTIGTLAKVAIGNNRQVVNIQGSEIISAGGAPFPPIVGGLLTQKSNIGMYSRNKLCWVPELNLNLSCKVTNRLGLTFGYTALWMSSVVVAGDQIDHQVNISQQTGPLVGPARPAFSFSDRSYWVQGMNGGVTWDF